MLMRRWRMLSVTTSPAAREPRATNLAPLPLLALPPTVAASPMAVAARRAVPAGDGEREAATPSASSAVRGRPPLMRVANSLGRSVADVGTNCEVCDGVVACVHGGGVAVVTLLAR